MADLERYGNRVTRPAWPKGPCHGKGSTFFIRLPIAGKATRATAA